MAPSLPLHIEGLDELIAFIELHYADGMRAAREAIASDKIGFWHLAELYKPGSMVVRSIAGMCVCGYVCVWCGVYVCISKQ